MPQHNKGSLAHDALGGAVAYEVRACSLFELCPFMPTVVVHRLRPIQAFKAYEDHLAKNGKPDSHAKAKEIL